MYSLALCMQVETHPEGLALLEESIASLQAEPGREDGLRELYLAQHAYHLAVCALAGSYSEDEKKVCDLLTLAKRSAPPMSDLLKAVDSLLALHCIIAQFP